jgi:hypothetical protein
MPTPPANKPSREVKVELKVEDALHYLDQVSYNLRVSYDFKASVVDLLICFVRSGENGISRQTTHLQ